MAETKTVSIRVNVTPTVQAELTRIAERHDVSVAHVIRKAIRDYLAATNGGAVPPAGEA